MNILITESQLKQMIDEAYNEKYANYLLDKISAKGMNSLTPQERSDLSKLSDDNDTSDFSGDSDVTVPKHKKEASVDSSWQNMVGGGYDETEGEMHDKFRMFMNQIPEYSELDINGETWHIEVEDMEGEHINLTNGEKSVYVKPFWESDDSVTVEMMDGEAKKFMLNKTPHDEAEMQLFVYHFVKSIVPHIVKTLFKI